MDRKTRQLLFTLIFAAIGFAGVFALAANLDSSRPALPEGFEDRDLSLQGARLRGYSIGLEGLVADWYWMQSLQYIGGKILRNPQIKVSIDNLNPLNPRLLYPYLDNATSLDPRFTAPYYYGAVVLPAIDKRQAILIAEKGIANNPNEWRLYQHLGFIHWKLGEYEKAAEVYERGAKIPGAPSFMQLMVARMKTEGGSRETARAIYRQMFDEAENTRTKELSELRLLELDSFDERDGLRQAINSFRDLNGRCPKDWAELLPTLRNIKLPRGLEFRIDRDDAVLDPTNAPYVLNRESCEVTIDPEKSKLPS